MEINRPPKLKVFLTAAVFCGSLVVAQVENAHAYVDPVTAAYLGMFVIVGTYAAAKATVCTPVAAVSSWDHAAGFGGVFKDCWDWSPFSKQPGTKGEQAGDDARPDSYP